MAAPKENLLSFGHLTGMEQNTFAKQREHCAITSLNKPKLLQADFSNLRHLQHLKKMHLQQRWQELKDREHAAQEHNRQLLLQFEEAQDTLKDMLARNAAMKTIRVEYERYLVESSPRWQQQLEEKTQTAQKKCLQQRMEDCLRSYRKIREEERVTKSSADRPLLSQGSTTRPQQSGAPQAYSSQEYSNYNQDGFSHRPYTQSSPLNHSQSHTGRFPIRVPYRPHASSQVPPSFVPHPHPFPLHHLTPMPGHHHHHPPWLRQDPPDWASPQPDYPWSWAAGAAGIRSGSEALWGQIYMEEPPPESRVSQTVGEDKTSRASSSKAERGSGSRSSYLSQELDIKPVRLSSGLADSSESGRDSSLASRETRKRREKRGRTQRSSSDREKCSSHESSRTSSAIVIASAAVAQSSESDASSEKHCNSSSSRRTRRSGGLTVGSLRSEEVAKKRTRSKGDDSESTHTGEELGSSSEESKSKKLGNQSHDDKSESCKEELGPKREEEPGSDSVKIENDKEESSSSEEGSSEKNNEERKKILGPGEDDGDEENSRRNDQEEDRDVEGDDEEVCARKNTTEEEEDTAAGEEMGDKGDEEEQPNSLKKNDSENRKQGSASSQDEEEDEDGSEDSENKLEEDKEGSDEEEDEDGSEGSEDNVGEDKEGSDEAEDGSEGSENKIGEDKEGTDEEEDEDGSEGSENKLEEDKEGTDEEEDEDGSEGSENKLEEDKEGTDEEEDDDDGSEGSEDNEGEDEEGSKKEEDGESEEGEEHRSNEAGKPEGRDSDDSIVSPQEKRSIQVHVTPEEAAEDEGDEEEEEDEEEEGSKPGSCNDDSNELSDDDIEDLLAPQEQTKEEKDLKVEEKPKAFPDSMKIFQVEQNTSKTNLPNNSDEFDDFYD